ncbi:hypothetical protein ACOMHN_060463 [Nucella lapillus]
MTAHLVPLGDNCCHCLAIQGDNTLSMTTDPVPLGGQLLSLPGHPGRQHPLHDHRPCATGGQLLSLPGHPGRQHPLHDRPPHATGETTAVTARPSRETTPSPTPSTSGMQDIRQHYLNAGFTEDATTLLLSSWRPATQRACTTYINKWKQYAEGHGIAVQCAYRGARGRGHQRQDEPRPDLNRYWEEMDAFRSFQSPPYQGPNDFNRYLPHNHEFWQPDYRECYDDYYKPEHFENTNRTYHLQAQWDVPFLQGQPAGNRNNAFRFNSPPPANQERYSHPQANQERYFQSPANHPPTNQEKYRLFQATLGCRPGQTDFNHKTYLAIYWLEFSDLDSHLTSPVFENNAGGHAEDYLLEHLQLQLKVVQRERLRSIIIMQNANPCSGCAQSFHRILGEVLEKNKDVQITIVFSGFHWLRRLSCRHERHRHNGIGISVRTTCYEDWRKLCTALQVPFLVPLLTLESHLQSDRGKDDIRLEKDLEEILS